MQVDPGTLNSTVPVTYHYGGTGFTNFTGNYWSDYAGTDSNGDGLGETPYLFGAGTDYAPLINKWSGGNATILGGPAPVAAPIASLTANVTSGTAPLAVLFNDTSTGSTPMMWNWSFGDTTWFNTTDISQRNITHIFGVGTWITNLTVSECRWNFNF